MQIMLLQIIKTASVFLFMLIWTGGSSVLQANTIRHLKTVSYTHLTVAFGVLLLYMIFTAFLLVTSTHIESYQVTTGPLSRNETYTGISPVSYTHLDVYKRQMVL